MRYALFSLFAIALLLPSGMVRAQSLAPGHAPSGLAVAADSLEEATPAAVAEATRSKIVRTEATRTAAGADSIEEDSTEEDGGGSGALSVSVQDGPEVTFNGAVRFNATYRGYVPADEDRLGDFFFETFIVQPSASYEGLTAAADYRFYLGYHMLKYGYVSYAFNDKLTASLGVHRVPFGPLPYVGNSWFFQLSYYLGFEDDFDLGGKVVYQDGPWDLRAAFYKTEEGSYTGASEQSARYSFDVVPTNSVTTTAAGDERPLAGNEEVNQGNLRLAYTLDHGAAGSTEIGASGQLGGLYNATTERMGNHWAAAGHLDGTYGPLSITLEALRYEHNPENPETITIPIDDDDDPTTPDVDTEVEPSDRFVVMGAFDFPYEVARDGNLYQAGISYNIPVEWGPFTSVTLYNDFAYFDKDVPGDDIVDSPQNIAGVLFSTGNLFIYNDLVYAKNEPFAVPGEVYGNALGRGSDEWYTRFNINIGYYF